jgi:beta-glucosidase
VVGCKDETNNYYEIKEEEPPTPPVDPCAEKVNAEQPVLGFAPTVPVDGTGAPYGTAKTELTVDGLKFRDLNGSGTLDLYEDWRYSDLCRAMDLVGRMTVPQKVGLMNEAGGLGNGTADGTIPDNVKTNIITGHVRQGLVRFGTVTAQQLAVYLNNVQMLAEVLPLGIPVAVTADPAHATSLSMSATGVQTQGKPTVWTGWPGTLGLGAINDPEVTLRHGDCVRREFMAAGLRWQLGPMADISTEPRWSRVPGTLGSNALQVAKHIEAMVIGFQGSATGNLRNGIAATLKHFPGHGAEDDGMDAHGYAGRFNVYPGDNLEYHFISFQAGFDVGAAAIMPCYSIYKEQYDYDPHQIPSGFVHGFITKLAKERMGFTGMVTADWGTAGSRAFNLEALSNAERAALWLAAGSHQYGSDPSSSFQEAYDQGLVTEDDIDGAAVKILEMTFKLGLFENPYVDSDATATIVRSVENRREGFEAQKRAIVLLKNREHSSTSASAPRYLPVNGTRFTDQNANGTPDIGEYACDTDGDGQVEVYYDGVVDSIVADPTKPDDVNDFLGDYDYTFAGVPGTSIPVVAVPDIAQADIAIIRIATRGGAQTAGIPLSYDGTLTPEELGYGTDGTLASAAASKKKVLDAFRVRDGYTDSTGTVVPAQKTTLKIVLVQAMGRPGIVRPFIQGLVSLDEKLGEAGSYPTVSDESNVRADGLGGVDAFLVDFGAFDRAVLDFVFNANVPAGVTYGAARLPIEIPSTDAEVKAQFEDLPNDTRYPTYQFGAGSALPTN